MALKGDYHLVRDIVECPAVRHLVAVFSQS
jgi:hypothetical protein